MDVYSGHDVTIMPILMRLADSKEKAATINWPEYASHLQFECWANEEETGEEAIIVVRYVQGEPKLDSSSNFWIPTMKTMNISFLISKPLTSKQLYRDV